MGLIFPLQPDTRKSSKNQLVLASKKSRFGLGVGFIFMFFLLATMFLAASPVMKMMSTQGGNLDKLIVWALYFFIGLSVIAALYCWFVEEVVIIGKSDSKYKLTKYIKILFFKFKKQVISFEDLSSFSINNWKGAENVASKEKPNSQYSTKGHWILKCKNILIEKRAKKFEIEEIHQKIFFFFKKEK